MGRPKADIDWNKVNEYLRAHCDGTAIASLLGICADTLYLACEREFNMTFSAYSQQKRAEGVTIVEDSIYKDAISKGGADRIFWLKNKAGWRDRQDIDIGGSVHLHFDKDDANA